MAATGPDLTLAQPPGSRIVIAGGAGGIGRALTRACLDAGHTVVVLDLPASLDHAPPDPAAETVAFDAADSASIAAATAALSARHDRIDGFVFLCGYQMVPDVRIEHIDPEAWQRLMAVNLDALYRLSVGIVPLLKRSERAAIVTVASGLAYQPMPGKAAYAVSKGGLISLTKALAAENAPQVRANVVAPGAVDTAFLGGGTARDEATRDRSAFDGILSRYEAAIPLGRIAEPDDIVGPILFLLGPASRYMTGQVLHLDGGRRMI